MKERNSSGDRVRAAILIPVDILIMTTTVAAFAILALLVLAFGACRGAHRRTPRARQRESLHGV